MGSAVTPKGPKVTRNLGSTIRPISGTYRRQIRSLYLAKVSETTLNDERRKILEDAIFAVENDLEHRSGPSHPQVVTMRAIRNVLLDDIPAEKGGNETWAHIRWPHVEAMAARISSGRRRRVASHESGGDEVAESFRSPDGAAEEAAQ